jgi:hypothetical protein
LSKIERNKIHFKICSKSGKCVEVTDGKFSETCDCGKKSCDSSKNLVGECENSYDPKTDKCEECELKCDCLPNFFDCDKNPDNGCESTSTCS